ncbi:MAG: HlyD family efflux transporter periplasmic adaptor subunit [Saprospiraceae bacterium]|nr:HlyD family efflux transporter periplasmic adaptor subunit [Saprospiraceae bacterium]MDZ4703068.1 HlyD family efflux transporter periplasmic adaptor subunit [Saprospiraceae bacterium]
MRRGCLISAGAFLLLASIGLIYYFVQQGRSDADDFELEKPVVSDIVKKAVATGAIKPRLEVNIKPQVSGVVEALFVEAGQIVKKGQPIARIQLIPSELNINSAQSNVEIARLRLKEAQRELDRQRELNRRNLDVEGAKVTYENAKREEERQRGLFEEGVISQQEYNRFKVDLEIQKAAYENSRVGATNSIKQFETTLDIQKQELNAAMNNLQLLREGASRQSKQVANVVVSTIDGMVLDIPVEVGSSVIERNNFNEGTSVAIIADMNSLIFEGKVDEAEVGKLKEGMLLEVTVGAIESEKFEATLEFISPKGLEEEGTVKFEVRAALKPSNKIFLRAGYSANADIIFDRRKQVVAIKERDVLFELEKAFVEVQTADRVFEKRPVELGLSDGILVEVRSGVDTTMQLKVQKKAPDQAED